VFNRVTPTTPLNFPWYGWLLEFQISNLESGGWDRGYRSAWKAAGTRDQAWRQTNPPARKPVGDRQPSKVGRLSRRGPLFLQGEESTKATVLDFKGAALPPGATGSGIDGRIPPVGLWTT